VDERNNLRAMPSNETLDQGPQATVWLVSYSADDDREMAVTEIAEALGRGEIDGETIVWTDGMPEWLPVRRVPVLAKLMAASGLTAGAPNVAETGGFLGTGLSLEPVVVPQSPKRSSKPPLPPKRSSRPPPAEVEEAPESVEPLSLSPESAAALRGPEAPEAAKESFTIGDTEPSSTEDIDGEPIEEAPSSGTPSLTALASMASTQTTGIDDEILGLGGSTPPPLEPPSIDLSGIADETSRPPTITIDDAKTTEDRHTTPPTAPTGARFVASTSPPPAPVKNSSSMLPWLVALLASGVAIWVILQRPDGTNVAPREAPLDPVAAPRAPEPQPEPPAPAAGPPADDEATRIRPRRRRRRASTQPRKGRWTHLSPHPHQSPILAGRPPRLPLHPPRRPRRPRLLLPQKRVRRQPRLLLPQKRVRRPAIPRRQRPRRRATTTSSLPRPSIRRPHPRHSRGRRRRRQPAARTGIRRAGPWSPLPSPRRGAPSGLPSMALHSPGRSPAAVSLRPCGKPRYRRFPEIA
jgi:hypothetical protein